MFADRATIEVQGGRGGDGCVSFRREAHVPRGGPDGGDGGRGGDVVLICDTSRRDLESLRMARNYRARKGGNGSGQQRHGARGDDIEILVPPGTQVIGLEGEGFDLVENGQRAVIAQGGVGGHGNKRFATSTRQAPRFAERGIDGQEGTVELHLKLLADAGFVGLPNAGKSSLLARMTRAAPKVAGYAFTTLSPVLGTLELPDRQLVLADIPGLIEGAAEGAGLGHEFLAHVERCRVLLHAVEIRPEGEPEGIAPDPVDAYRTVRAELAAHGAGLDALPEILLLTKADLTTPERVKRLVAEWRELLGDDVRDVLAVSSATGEGIDALSEGIEKTIAEVDLAAAEADRSGWTPSGDGSEAGPEFQAEHRLYRPVADHGYDVVELEQGVFEIRGRGIEMLIERHDLGNAEAVGYVEQRLRDIGVIAALRSAGFERGDEVIIGGEAFNLDTAG